MLCARVAATKRLETPYWVYDLHDEWRNSPDFHYYYGRRLSKGRAVSLEAAVPADRTDEENFGVATGAEGRRRLGEKGGSTALECTGIPALYTDWCNTNCNHSPPNCPSKGVPRCSCSSGGGGSGEEGGADEGAGELPPPAEPLPPPPTGTPVSSPPENR